MLELGILFSSSFGVRGRFSFSGVVLLQRENIELLEAYQEWCCREKDYHPTILSKFLDWIRI